MPIFRKSNKANGISNSAEDSLTEVSNRLSDLEVSPGPSFDNIFYGALYPDLLAAGIKSSASLKQHFEDTGQHEGRVGNFTHWLEQNKLPTTLFPVYPDWNTLADLNDLHGDASHTVATVICALLDLEPEKLVVSEDPLEQATFLSKMLDVMSSRGQDIAAARSVERLLEFTRENSEVLGEKFHQIVNYLEYDDEFYREMYPDLRDAEINTVEARKQHFVIYGSKEGRSSSIRAWLLNEGFPASLLGIKPDMAEIVSRTAQYGTPVTWRAALETLLGKSFARVWFAPTAEENAEIYFAAAMAIKNARKTGDSPEERRVSSINLTKIACSFNASDSAILAELAHYHIAENQNRIAAGLFERALNCDDGDGLDVVPHLAWIWRSLGEIDKAYELFEHYLPKLRRNDALLRQLDDFCGELWRDVETRTYSSIITDQRDDLISRTEEELMRIYRLHTLAMGGDELPPKLGRVDASRVLIVGDYFLPQCKRYRIDQKVEQLEAAGIKAETIDWTKIDEQMTELSFYDVVIFYRVPAVSAVIKAIAQVNLSGRLSIYEIDDLLFDPLYPPSIDTYGGSVALDEYAGLMRGMSLFRAAAKMCRVGLASTIPLQERLASLVRSGQCLLHRNGLDHINAMIPSHARAVNPERINLFYGSGTKAHNSDFIELSLPAVARILKRDSRVKLIIAGYLELPESFAEEFQDQLVRLPPTKDISVYYNYLGLADINLATLQSDPVTDSKSELKWFEAAWFGVPSVVSDTRNYLDVVKDGEDGFIAATPDDWERCITTLINDEDLRRRMGEAARARVRSEYSVQTLGTKLRKALEECVVEHAGPANSKKRVAMVNVFFSPQSVGGATRVFEGNIDGYINRHREEFEPVVFTSNLYESTPHQMQLEAYGNLRVYRSNVLFRRNMDWMAQDAKMAVLFRRFLETERPDCVHFHCVQRLTASVVDVTREMGIPYVVTMHDAWWFSDHQFLVDEKGKIYPEGHPGEKWVTEASPPEGATMEESLSRKAYLSSLIFGADRVLTVSNGFANICRKNGFEQTEVATNGIAVDIDWAPKRTGGTKRVVGAHVGSMSAHKGYDLLRAMVMRVQPQNMEFLVVNHAMPEGWTMRDHWGHVPVKFIGRASQEHIAEIYAQCDVLFAPSIWPESFGLVTREAAACGCWIVASSLGAIGEDVTDGKNGFVIEPTEAEMRRVLETIDANPERYKGLAPFDHLRSANDQADQIAAVYGEIMKREASAYT